MLKNSPNDLFRKALYIIPPLNPTTKYHTASFWIVKGPKL